MNANDGHGLSSQCSRSKTLTLLLLNVSIVAAYIVGLLHRDSDLLGPALALGSAIAVAQALLLCRVDGTLARLLTMYVALLSFLFCFGVVAAWDLPVGAGAAGSWQSRLAGGARLVFLGQVFAIPALVVLAPINLWLLGRGKAVPARD